MRWFTFACTRAVAIHTHAHVARYGLPYTCLHGYTYTPLRFTVGCCSYRVTHLPRCRLRIRLRLRSAVARYRLRLHARLRVVCYRVYRCGCRLLQLRFCRTAGCYRSCGCYCHTHSVTDYVRCSYRSRSPRLPYRCRLRLVVGYICRYAFFCVVHLVVVIWILPFWFVTVLQFTFCHGCRLRLVAVVRLCVLPHHARYVRLLPSVTVAVLPHRVGSLRSGYTPAITTPLPVLVGSLRSCGLPRFSLVPRLPFAVYGCLLVLTVTARVAVRSPHTVLRAHHYTRWLRTRLRLTTVWLLHVYHVTTHFLVTVAVHRMPHLRTFCGSATFDTLYVHAVPFVVYVTFTVG